MSGDTLSLLELAANAPWLVFGWLLWQELKGMRASLDKTHRQLIEVVSQAFDRTDGVHRGGGTG